MTPRSTQHKFPNLLVVRLIGGRTMGSMQLAYLIKISALGKYNVLRRL